MSEDLQQELDELRAALIATLDALRRGRSADNPALQEELTALASRLRSTRRD
jgi:hypothetical protein